MAFARSAFVGFAGSKRAAFALSSGRSFMVAPVLCKGGESTAASAAHSVGDTIEKAGKNLRESAQENKEPAESNMRSQVRSAAEKIGSMTEDAGDKIEHSMADDDSKLKKRNLEDKQVLSN